jgi:hypothetical protein
MPAHIRWLRRKHPRTNWKELRRRFTVGRMVARPTAPQGLGILGS